MILSVEVAGLDGLDLAVLRPHNARRLPPPAMTFDDELKRTFDTLTGRLREMDRQVRAAMDELSASARSDAAANTAVAVAAPPPWLEPAAQSDAVLPGPAADERLLQGIRAIDAARSLSGILEALIAASADDNIGAGVWLVRDRQVRHWRSTGIAEPPGDCRLDDDHDHRAIADAARTKAPASHDGLAVPLALAGHVVAVLFVVSRHHASPIRNPAAIELLARHAAKCLESVTAFKTARAMAARASTSAAERAWTVNP
jgi:hypothetical protein